MSMKRNRLWIQKSGIKKHKGALHRALGIPESKTIPIGLLTKTAERNDHVGRMAKLAVRLRSFRNT
jgi:hypothetical protein